MEYVTASSVSGIRARIFQFPLASEKYPEGSATLVLWHNGEIILDEHYGLREAQDDFRRFCTLFHLEIEAPK